MDDSRVQQSASGNVAGFERPECRNSLPVRNGEVLCRGCPFSRPPNERLRQFVARNPLPQLFNRRRKMGCTLIHLIVGITTARVGAEPALTRPAVARCWIE